MNALATTKLSRLDSGSEAEVARPTDSSSAILCLTVCSISAVKLATWALTCKGSAMTLSLSFSYYSSRSGSALILARLLDCKWADIGYRKLPWHTLPCF